MASPLAEFSVLLDEGVEFVPVAGAVVEVRDYTDPSDVVRLLPDLVADGDGLVAAASLDVPAGSKIRLAWKDGDTGRCGMSEAVTGAGYTMDIVSRRSGGQNIVSRPQARPNWYRGATAPAARAQVWKRNADQPPAAAVMVGVFELGQEYKLDYNPATDRNVVLGLNPLSADGTPCFTRPEDFVWAELPVERATVPVAGLDEHVPTVTLPPTIAKEDGADRWVVLTPAPDAYGATLTDGEIWVEKADDPAVYWGNIPIGTNALHIVGQENYPAKVRYRWRNQSSEDAGNGRGWSDWSPYADAAGAGDADQPPPVGDALTSFTFDANDSRAGIEKGVIGA